MACHGDSFTFTLRAQRHGEVVSRRSPSLFVLTVKNYKVNINVLAAGN
jgi:hypothetical protein